MDRLFAPWRHAWVTGAEAGGSTGTTCGETACLFCRVWGAPENDDDNLVVFRGEHAFVMLNRFPYNAGHLMIAPVLHRGALPRVPAPARAEMMELAARSLVALETVYRPHGCNLGINQGRAAGAGIPDHVHLHAVPRWNGDTNFMTTVGDTRVISEDLASSRTRLAAAFAAGADTP